MGKSVNPKVRNSTLNHGNQKDGWRLEVRAHEKMKLRHVMEDLLGLRKGDLR